MSVQRFNLSVECEYGYSFAEMNESEDGEYIEFEDYKKLEQKYKKLCKDSQKYENLVRKAVEILNTSIREE